MAIIKWTFWGVIWLIIAAFFHYTLPQVDIVRITDTYEKRIDFGENSISLPTVRKLCYADLYGSSDPNERCSMTSHLTSYAPSRPT